MTFHIHKNMKGEWVIRKRGATRARKAFQYPFAAVVWASQRLDVSDILIVHRSDGTPQVEMRFYPAPIKFHAEQPEDLWLERNCTVTRVGGSRRGTKGAI